MGYKGHQVLRDHKEKSGHKVSRGNQVSRGFNLRKCSHQQNSCNRRSNINSTSKYLGVSYCKKRMRWIAQIEKKGKKSWGGVFSDEKSAAIAYNNKAIQIHGEFANLNIV